MAGLICAFAGVLGVLGILGIVSPRASFGHGSLPISQQIMWRGDTMLVPAAYWGIFLGTDGGPWQWICEEAINTNQSRQMMLVSDGTIYATDRMGLTVSRDNGCTWEAITSGVNTLQIGSLLADPVRARGWALASSSDGMENGLWYSDDAGRTWQKGYAMPSYLPSGVRISPDGRTLVIGSVTNALPRQAVLHVSTDGGMNFTTQILTVQLDGQPLTFFRPTWIDPRPPAPLPIYLQAEVVDGTALLRIDGAAQPVEVLRVPGVITQMAQNPSRDKVFVATTKGMYVTATTGPFTKIDTLAATQCLSEHNGNFYACAWNFAPDLAAIAKLPNDASSYTRVFQFDKTMSPVDCPASTPVAQICPQVWFNYADQLGINLHGDMGTTTDTPTGCSCQLGGAATSAEAVSTLALLFSLFAATRRRRRN